MKHSVAPEFATGWANYNTASYEGLQAFWNDDDYITHIRGFIRQTTGHSIVAGTPLDFIASDLGQTFPWPAGSESVIQATGNGLIKLSTTATIHPVLLALYASANMQADVSGTVQWAQIDLTYQGVAF